MADEAATLGEVAIRVTADSKPLEQSFSKLRSEAERFGRQLQNTPALSGFRNQIDLTSVAVNKFGTSIGAMAKSFLPLVGVSAAVGALTKAFKDFAEEEREIAGLAQQLKLLGTNAGITIDQLEDFTDQLVKTTGFTDSAIRAAERYALALGLTGREVTSLTHLATELAARMQTDVPQAMEILARTANRPVETLRQLKRMMNIDPETEALVRSLVKAGRPAEAANLIFSRLSGELRNTAEVMHATTSQGALNDLNNAFEKLSEAAGKLLANAGLPQFIRDIAAAVNALAGAVEGLDINKFSLITRGPEGGIDWLSTLLDPGLMRRLRELREFLEAPVATGPGMTQEMERRFAIAHAPGQSLVTLPTLRPPHITRPPGASEEDKAALDAAADAAEQYRDALQEVVDERDLLWLSPSARAAAEAARNAFGDEWREHLNDAVAQMARLNEQLSEAYEATRDFAGTFTHGILDGKSAVDALTDALTRLESRLIDMALDNVIKGLFAGLSGSGFFSNITGGGGVSGGVFQTGGFVGSTPVPSLFSKKKLEYDEFPAILHVGERVIPAGGTARRSGRDMVRMFGGIPHFESGFNAGAAAAGAYQAGDTGATGQWSIVSGGGGNTYQSAWLASQYTQPTYSPSSYTGSGTRPSAGSVAPRFAGYPISGPDIRRPIIGSPLPSIMFPGPSDLVPFGPAFPGQFGTTPFGIRVPTTIIRQPPNYPDDVWSPEWWPSISPSWGFPMFRQHGAGGTRRITGSGSRPSSGFSYPSSSPGFPYRTPNLYLGGNSPLTDPGIRSYNTDPAIDPYNDPRGRLYTPTQRVYPWFRGYHQGGVVGSTPAKLFMSAPRLHDGLGYDEYPAILQGGERVIARGGDSGSGRVSVTVINNTAAGVNVQEGRDTMGGVKIDIVVDDIVSGKMRDGSSKISRTMATMGAKMGPIRR